MAETIKVSQRDDERDGTVGLSASQTSIFAAAIGDTTVRLIDTPGIGRVEKDKENITDILKTLKRYDKIHGTLILLKPNTARLSVMFKYCIKELLTHLHRDAAQNIVFGFTNSRCTNYTPGDAFGPLSDLLEEYRDVGIGLWVQTVYCFDSESFRFLAAHKNGVQMEQIDDFRLSWDRSWKEVKRLLEHFRTLPAHLVRSTLSLNRTRELIIQLSHISDKIDTAICINIQTLQELSNYQLESVRNTIESSKNKITEAEKEKKEIQEATVRFGLFVKENSIKLYNDTTLECLDTSLLAMTSGGGINCPRIVPLCHHNEDTALPTDLLPVSVRATHANNLNNASYNQSFFYLNCSIPVYLCQDSKSFP